MNRKRSLVAILGFAAAAGAVFAAWASGPAAAGDDATRIAALVHELEAMDPPQLDEQPALAVERFSLPDASVHVMRARLEETYAVDGVGEDTVELTGWIAVKHDNARPASGRGEVEWSNAVLDTEFVGMDLTGTSDLFGKVRVRLDPSRPSRGQVGQIRIPEVARVLLADLRPAAGAGDDAGSGPQEKGDRAAARPAAGQPTFKPLAGSRTIKAPVDVRMVAPLDPARLSEPELLRTMQAPCEAPLAVNVEMSDLGLRMTTETHTVWYSLVDTIPPVGQTASITLEPVRLLAGGRPVGTLLSGRVKFREVIRHLPLGEPFAGHDRVAALPPEAAAGAGR